MQVITILKVSTLCTTLLFYITFMTAIALFTLEI